MNRYLVLVALASSLSQSLCAPAMAQEDHKWQFTEVAGNSIAWSCVGAGQPTMILIAGGGLSAHDSFGRIYHNYAGPGRVCMYDRAGVDKSTFSNPQTRSLDQLVEELRGVSVANSWGEAVLVPHSFGGFIARAYAHKYAKDVRAILFLDVAQEDWLPQLKKKMSTSDWTIMERILAWTERTLHEDYVQAQEAVRSTKLSKNLPITVLARGIPHTRIRIEKMSYEGIDIYESENTVAQKKIAKLSGNSKLRVARYSSHVFNDFDPWVVIDEMKLLTERLPK